MGENYKDQEGKHLWFSEIDQQIQAQRKLLTNTVIWQGSSGRIIRKNRNQVSLWYWIYWGRKPRRNIDTLKWSQGSLEMLVSSFEMKTTKCILLLPKAEKQNMKFKDWRDVSVVQNIDCSSSGPWYNSQYPHGSSLILVSGNSMPSLGLRRYQAHTEIVPRGT